MVPMKILYDISVLGLAHYHERARTGIYRVVANVLQGVMAFSEFKVHCFASHGNDLESLEFLKANPEFTPLQETFVAVQSGSVKAPAKWEKLIDRLSRKLLGRVIDRSAYSRIKADICHSPFYALPDEIVSNRLIVKVQTVHDLIPLKMPHLFAFNDDDQIKRILSKLGPETFIICMSESTRNDLLEYKKELDPSKVRVVYSAASESFYHCGDEVALIGIRRKYGIPEDARYLLSVSTLEPRKNIDHVIRCFLKVLKQERLQDLYLVLTGVQGWKYDSILAEIDGEQEFRDRIILTGFVPDEDLAPLYSGALAFVYMSLYEGFGLPPLEAMQCGIPVIASNTSSLPEVVGDAGILLDPTDADSLCKAYLNLYQNGSYAAELSIKSIARAAEFRWSKTVAETMAVYRKAVSCG